MEVAPPTYEESNDRSVWKLVAKHLALEDICSAVLVCTEWHRIFIQRLWGNPAASFEHEGESVQDVLTRFLAALDGARQSIRYVTYVLHFPLDSGDLYTQPTQDWVAKILIKLPNLQALLVPGLPYFDSFSLSRLRLPKPDGGSNRLIGHGLRLLVATDCENVTNEALSQAFESFPHLIYLDLSGTLAARSTSALQALQMLHNIKVVKLRRLGLSHEGVSSLAKGIAWRVQSLDICDNQLTDESIRELTDKCIIADIPEDGSEEDYAVNGNHTVSFLKYNSVNAFDELIWRTLTDGPVRELDIENVATVGITHMRLCGNSISSKGVTKLLNCGRFVSLDIASVPIHKRDLSEWWLPNLRVLRAHHSLITNLSVSNVPVVDRSTGSSNGASLEQHNQDLDDILQERMDRLEGARTGEREGISPMKFPLLETLVLTDVPVVSKDSKIVDSLIAFIKECATEASLAARHADLDYSIPPRRSREVAVKEHASMLFPLRSITLQMRMTPLDTAVSPKDEPRSPTGYGSVTEDADSDAFWSAGATDFSFFPGEGSGLTSEQTGSSSSPTEGILSRNIDSTASSNVETLKVLSAFRREARAKCDPATSQGAANPAAAGYWEGNINIEWS